MMLIYISFYPQQSNYGICYIIPDPLADLEDINNQFKDNLSLHLFPWLILHAWSAVFYTVFVCYTLNIIAMIIDFYQYLACEKPVVS